MAIVRHNIINGTSWNLWRIIEKNLTLNNKKERKIKIIINFNDQ